MNFENVCSDFCQGHGPFMDFVLLIVQKDLFQFVLEFAPLIFWWATKLYKLWLVILMDKLQIVRSGVDCLLDTVLTVNY